MYVRVYYVCLQSFLKLKHRQIIHFEQNCYVKQKDSYWVAGASPTCHQHATFDVATLHATPEGVARVEQTNGSEIERSARNPCYMDVYLFITDPFLITPIQIKIIVFFFQVGVIEKEIAELGGRGGE